MSRINKIFYLGIVLVAMNILSACAVKHKREADTSKIIDAYKSEKEQVKTCYYKALQENPKLQGNVTIAWVVDGKGALKKAWVKDSNLQDVDMENCLLDHLKTVSFPPTQSLAKITVEYTLNFSR